MAATKNAHDWHCEDHDTYGWRGEECRKCPTAPSEADALRNELNRLVDLCRQLYEAERRYNKFKAVEAENAALEMALRQLLAAAMPIRADRATLQDVARAIPALYDACHSAAITLNLK
jgi:hypothetical protein